jgi:hypothetical protein
MNVIYRPSSEITGTRHTLPRNGVVSVCVSTPPICVHLSGISETAIGRKPFPLGISAGSVISAPTAAITQDKTPEEIAQEAIEAAYNLRTDLSDNAGITISNTSGQPNWDLKSTADSSQATFGSSVAGAASYDKQYADEFFAQNRVLLCRILLMELTK